MLMIAPEGPHSQAPGTVAATFEMLSKQTLLTKQASFIIKRQPPHPVWCDIMQTIFIDLYSMPLSVALYLDAVRLNMITA